MALSSRKRPLLSRAGNISYVNLLALLDVLPGAQKRVLAVLLHEPGLPWKVVEEAFGVRLAKQNVGRLHGSQAKGSVTMEDHRDVCRINQRGPVVQV